MTRRLSDPPSGPETRSVTGLRPAVGPGSRPAWVPTTGDTRLDTVHGAASGRSPRGLPALFYWSEPRLAGMSLPSSPESIEPALCALEALGVRSLVVLERAVPISVKAARVHGLALRVEAPARFDVPSGEQALALCRQAEAQRSSGQGVAFACRSGVHRAGLLLAAHRVFRGEAPAATLEWIRWAFPSLTLQRRHVDFLADLSLLQHGESLRPGRPE